MPGRQKCDCQAQKHDLINNCLACGRIVCEQEGEGPCLFCGEMVLYPDVAYISDENLKKALARKDMLLDFDRNSSKRTEVVDDETDYYRGVDEEKIREVRHGSRLNKKFCLDLGAGDMVEQTLDEFIDEHAVEEVVVEKRNNKELLLFNEDLGNNNLTYTFKKKDTVAKTEKTVRRSRIQDARLSEMCDTGTCLTMHQPWASLLIKGIKIHEGRVWPTNHRGRLWIHSSSRHADQETLDDVLKDHPEGKDLDWPISSLLGFVNVDDCLNQEDYREKYPDGKSQASYVFICSDPIELDIKLQMSGNHKLWKLPKDIQMAARAQLGL